MSTNETKETILDMWDSNGDPTAERYNVAVSVANANYRRAQRLETNLSEVCTKVADLLKVPHSDVTTAIALLGAVVQLLEERDAAARETVAALAARDKAWGQEKEWAATITQAREARDKADAIVDAAWKAIPWHGAVRGLVPLDEVIEGIVASMKSGRSLATVPQDSPIAERIAQLTAHRACVSGEHDPTHGKINGYCVVCGVEWPCPIATPKTPDQSAVDAERLARQMFSWGMDAGIAWKSIGGAQMHPQTLERQFQLACQRVEKGEWTVHEETVERRAFVAGVEAAGKIPAEQHIARTRMLELAFSEYKQATKGAPTP